MGSSDSITSSSGAAASSSRVPLARVIATPTASATRSSARSRARRRRARAALRHPASSLRRPRADLAADVVGVSAGLASARLTGLWPRSSQRRSRSAVRARGAKSTSSSSVALADRGQVEALLATEVARDQRRVDPGALADLAHRRGVVAALVEDRLGGLEQRRAAGLGVVRAARRLVAVARRSLMTSAGDITTADAPHRQHYGLTFAVLALGGAAYALLQSLVVPALPVIQHELHASADRGRLDLHRLPAQRLGRDADRRPPRRHVRQEAHARRRARRARARLAAGRARHHRSS